MKNVIHIMPEFGLAGAETMCEALCYELHNSGKYKVYAVSLYNLHTAITERMESNGIKIFYLGKSKGINIKIIIDLARILRKLNIDVIHTHRYVMQYAIPAAIIAGVKTRVHTIHNIAEKEVDSLRQKIAYIFYKYYKVTPVSISPLIQNSVIERYKLTKDQNPIIYNGKNLDECTIKRNFEAHKPFRFIHIGRFSKQKNHEAIIDAATILKSKGYNFIINFIGGAGNEEERKKEVIAKGLAKEFIFSGLQDNVYPFLEESDCFILPSLYEGMPITLIEAMGCGMPIIASAVGGVPDMLNHMESGLLISPNAEELSNAMIKMIEDDALRESIGKNALIESRRFSSKRMYEGYDKIYNKYNKNS